MDLDVDVDWCTQWYSLLLLAPPESGMELEGGTQGCRVVSGLSSEGMVMAAEEEMMKALSYRSSTLSEEQSRLNSTVSTTLD